MRHGLLREVGDVLDPLDDAAVLHHEDAVAERPDDAEAGVNARRMRELRATTERLGEQVAAVAAYTGLKCVLIQESWVDWPDSVYDKVGNILISRLAGADIRLVKAGFGIGFKESWDAAIAEVERADLQRHRRPSAERMPAGASVAGTSP